MSIAASGIESEYEILRRGCGIVDRSERGKLSLTGADAARFLHGQVTNDIEGLASGQGCYAAFLTAKGKMLGDLRVLNAGGELLLDTERSALQELFNMIRRFSIGYEVELHKRTLECSLLSLIGPEADAVLLAAGRASEGGIPVAPPGESEHDHVLGPLGRAIRTDVGIDLLFTAEADDAVRAALLQAGAVQAGEQAAECLRIERGRPRYGIDLDDTVIPQEAGLNERAVSFTKGCYVGQETVARLFYKGKPNRHLRGLRSDREIGPGSELLYDGRPAGRVTSSARSPRFGAIALAFVRREVPIGAEVEAVNGSGVGPVAAAVLELPFGA